MPILIFLCLFVIVGHSAESKLPQANAVASAHPLATNAGLKILAEGGNAFDAAIAISAVLAVVEPYHSGIGGGGFWLLHDEKKQQNIVIDGRERAPLAATKNMFLDKNEQPIPDLSLNGALAAAIPGEPAALVYLAQHYGRLPLKVTLQPAIDLAERGFPVDHQLIGNIQFKDRLQQLQKFPASSAIFLKQGQPYTLGEVLKQQDLANTLRAIGEHGHAGFYEGPIAEKLVNAVRQAGGIWSLEDLKQYQIKVRQPIEGYYKGLHVITTPPPSAGGIALLTMLNILNPFEIETTSASSIHNIVEAMRLVYWQRSQYLGDPDFVKVPVEKLISEKNARQLRAMIPANHALTSSQLNQVPQVEEQMHTTHFSVLDKEGNRVAATLSVNYIFGSGFVAQGTGVLLNDEMNDFSIKTNVHNVFGLIGSDKNAILPGKRPLSSMTPTFIETPERIAIFGTPGGSRIPTMVLIASLMFQKSFGAISMVSAMRFHHQYLPDVLEFEPDTFSEKIQQQLKQMGYVLQPLNQYYGDMQAITWDLNTNFITAASDPRHIGLAAVVAH